MKEDNMFFFDKKEFSDIQRKASKIEPDWNIYRNMLPVISQIPKSNTDPSSFIPDIKTDVPFEHEVAYHRFKWLKHWFMNRLNEKDNIKSDSKKVLSILKSWLTRYHRPSRPIWEPYSVSERLINWLWCLMWLRSSNSIGFADQKLIESALKAHLSYLEKNLEYHGEKTNNHIIKDAQGLLYGGCYFYSDKNAKRWRDTARDILIEELLREFSDNFVHLEQTSHYHCLVTRRYLECYLLADRTNLNWASELKEPVRQMLDAAYHLTFYDSKIPLFSDVSPDEPPDLVPKTILSAGGFIFDKMKYLQRSNGLNHEALWLLGSRVQDFEIDGMQFDKVKLSSSTLKIYPESFAAYDGEGLCWRLDCGPFGFKPNPGHGHDDSLSIQVWHDNHIWIRDSGIYTYDNEKWKKYFRARANHSTVLVDHDGKNEISSKTKDSDAHPIWSKTSDQIKAVLCEYNHYIGSGVIPQKRMILTSRFPEYMIIADFLTGSGSHSVQQLFHTDCDNVTEKENRFELIFKKRKFSVISKASKPFPNKIEKSYYSPCYEKKIEKPVLDINAKSDLPIVICTVLTPGSLKEIDTNISFNQNDNLNFAVQLNFGLKIEHFICSNPGKQKTSLAPFLGKFELTALILETGKSPILISDGECKIDSDFIRNKNLDMKKLKTIQMETKTY